MNYIYHLKPEPFIGTSLIPLNLMDKNSSLYQRHASKYIGREGLMLEVIPKLNCKWNDVVQFSALDPQVLVSKLREIHPDLNFPRLEYFKIPIEKIIPFYEAAIFERKTVKVKGDYSIHQNDIELLTLDSYREAKEVPAETLKYWLDIKKNGGSPLWFPYVPHVFVKGIIEISEFEIIIPKSQTQSA